MSAAFFPCGNKIFLLASSEVRWSNHSDAFYTKKRVINVFIKSANIVVEEHRLEQLFVVEETESRS